ncbi:MAG: class I mannose-6-phosphate isomerase [Planctomycetaceae bacterium]|nr:class I mannose-6-phosphate isomerase [Planctomycetaceae bacterium]
MEPLIFSPLLKRIRWGGRRLETLLGKSIGPEQDYAESWEICDHGADQCHVLSGPYRDWPLSRLVAECGVELFGEPARFSQFPLLIKFLDCHDRLSVQVHPDDEAARRFNPRENGKTEAWVVIDAQPGSVIYAGLRLGVVAEDLRAALSDGSLENLLHRISPAVGDCYFIPAGTVHALGEGVVVAEVQQSSDMTFRLYDWGHLDSEGNSRPLHIEEAFACIDFQQGPVAPTRPRMVNSDAGWQIEQLVVCPYFRMFRHGLSRAGELPRQPVCRVLMSLSGSGMLEWGQKSYALPRGQTCLLPASCPRLELRPTSPTPWQFLVAEVV